MVRSIRPFGSLRGYRRSWLVHDAGAAVALTALLVPAGMGYAQAAGLPAVTGLYTTITALVVYAAVGPSRLLVYGPDSSLSALIAAAVAPLAASSEQAVMLAGALSILTGMFCVAAGLARFGFLAELLSAPVRVGYLNGIAVTVALLQLPPLFGVEQPPAGGSDGSAGGPSTPLGALRNTIEAVGDRQVNGWALGIGLAAVGGLLAARRLAPKLPATLLAVAIPAGIGLAVDWPAKGVAVVGELPRRLPDVDWSVVSWSHVPQLAPAAAGIAFVAFADTSVLSRSLALRRGEHVEANHELVALGAVNVACGLTGGFAVSSSSSRTPVAERAGARSQLTGLLAAGVVAAVLVLAPGAMRQVPSAALAAVVVAAVSGLVDVRSPMRWARVRPSEFVLCAGAFVAIIALGVIAGIAVAIGVSVLEFMRRAWRPHATELVRVDGLKGYHDRLRHPDGRAVPGLLLYRFDAPLFFANAAFFLADVLGRVDADVRQVTVTAEPITDVDATAAEVLHELLDELDRRGVALTFADLKGHVRDQLDRYGLVARIGPQRFTHTVGEAVHEYVRRTGIAWQDWEDREPGAGGTDRPS